MTNPLRIFYGIMAIAIGILLLLIRFFVNINLLGSMLFVIFGLIIGFFILSFGLYIIFSWMIPGISIIVSKLSTYHRLKTDESPGETIWKKMFLVFLCNFILTIPIVLTILYILNPSSIIIIDKLGLSSLDVGVIVALSIIPGLLLILRLMSNPSRNGIVWRMGDYTLITIMTEYPGPLPENGETPPDIKKVKDDISSFFSTLIFGTLLFLFIQYCSDYLSSGSETQFLARYSLSIQPIVLFCYIIAYVATLVIVTAVGEYILTKSVPVDQK
jgi:hypothetical protein